MRETERKHRIRLHDRLLYGGMAAALLFIAGMGALAPSRNLNAQDNNADNTCIIGLNARGEVSAAAAIVDQYDLSGAEILPYVHQIVATCSPKELAALQNDPRIAFAEPDEVIKVADEVSSPSDVVEPVPWDLDRIDGRNGMDGKYSPPNYGEGSHIIFLDSGISANNEDLKDRIGEGASYDGSNSTEACDPHGNETADQAAGTKYGVARKAIVHPFRVLNCDNYGLGSWVVKGINGAIEYILIHNLKGRAVINASLSAPKSQKIDAAAEAAIEAGIPFIAAAGNEKTNACTRTPAGLSKVITVGATDKANKRALFSNYGPCVDIWAPGVNNRVIDENGNPTERSGTSYAAPIVAGVAAQVLEQSPGITPEELAAILVDRGTKGVVIGLSPEDLNVFVTTLMTSDPYLTHRVYLPKVGRDYNF